MPPNGSFFKFVEELQKLDRDKFADFEQLFAGNSRVFCSIRKKLDKRNDRIRQSQLKLRYGRLSVEQFLNEVAFPNHKAVTGMENATVSEVEEEEIEILEESQEQLESAQNDTGDAENRYQQMQLQMQVLQQELEEQRRLNERMICVVCKISLKTCCLLPCKHLALCDTCCEGLKEPRRRRRDRLFRCPVCRADVMQIQTPFF